MINTHELENEAMDLGIPLTVKVIADSRVLELYQYPLVLIRPDGHTAFRSEHSPKNAGSLWKQLCGLSKSTN